MAKFSQLRKTILFACLAVVLLAAGLGYTQTGLALGTNYYVRPGGNDAQCDGLTDADYSSGLTACAKQTIQAAIDAASAGDTVNVAAGSYDGTLDITGFTGLTIRGADKTTTILQPTSLLTNGICGTNNFNGRTSAIKVYNSTGVVIENLTIDMDLAKANFAHALFFCDSEGTVQNNIIQNLSLPDASGGYYEIGSDFRGPGYSAAAPAQVTLTGNSFIDTGRLGIVTHEFVDATITNNTFYKTTDDFGYAIEIGGPSLATIQDNLIYGFDTQAASDGSESAGIYIENAFTQLLTGISKPVLVERNEIYDCQYGMWIGNGYQGLTGDVDIQVTLNDNLVYDNLEGGIWIQDEEKEFGSSVTVTGSGNTLQDNGAYGYYIYTEGDGDITVDLSDETIMGHTSGVGVTDTTAGAGNSSYSIDIHQSQITGNSSFGVASDGPLVDATDNYWGSACGPGGEGAGAGNAVSANVLYSPWWADPSGTSSASEGASGEIIVPAGASQAEIQAVLDCAASGTTVTLTSGAYPGGLQVNSAGLTIDLNGCTVGPGSPAFTINAADVTVLGPGTLDGDTGSGNSPDPAIRVASGGDNFTLKDVEVQRWQDGVEVSASVTSFKLIGNWLHSNTAAGLQVNAGVSIGGITTIEGNLFKNNGAYGINNASGVNLLAEYNSWSQIDGPGGSGPGSGDAISANVDAEPFTYSELFMDVAPDTQALVRSVTEDDSFQVALKADAVNLYGLTFKLTYEPDKLTLNSTTFSYPWEGRCFAITIPEQPAGTLYYRCSLVIEPEWTSSGGTIATFNFTAQDNGGLTGSGPWSAYFDIVATDSSSAASGGVKVYLNNAGYNAPSTAERDLTNTAAPVDGQIDITGLAQFRGFIDLQGTYNDSGATLTVYDSTARATAIALAQGSSSASGAVSSAYLYSYQLLVGSTYWLYVDAPLYLPTTADTADNFGHSALLALRPLTTLSTVVLLGGDGTDDNVIGVGDLSCIGGSYLSSSTCTGGPGADADVNGDGLIDILDLTLMGGNYGQSASPWGLAP